MASCKAMQATSLGGLAPEHEPAAASADPGKGVLEVAVVVSLTRWYDEEGNVKKYYYS